MHRDNAFHGQESFFLCASTGRSPHVNRWYDASLAFLPRQAGQDRFVYQMLRRRVAQAFAQSMRQRVRAGNPPLHVVSPDGYRVYRIGIGDTELLLAIREYRLGAHVKYMYLDAGGCSRASEIHIHDPQRERKQRAG